MGIEGHPRGSRGGAGADLAGSPVPGRWDLGARVGPGPHFRGAEWSGAPNPQPQAQPCLQLPTTAPSGVADPDPATRSNSHLSTRPPCPPCPVPTSGSHWPQFPSCPDPPILSPGVAYGAGLRLSPPADEGCGLCCLASTWLAGGSSEQAALGGPSLPTRVAGWLG